MAKLRIFISSTCYDLSVLRAELRPFIIGMGFEPVMSDYSDILFDPRTHTHDSCLNEVPNCDMVLLIIGQRFGGTAIPSIISGLDIEKLKLSSTNPKILESVDKLSITQLEVLKAVEHSIPIYAFVDEKVLHDHHVYEKNKDKIGVIEEIDFPSIQNKETARYIFEFINFITHRVKNNSITEFSRLDAIKNTLVNQWSQLFQRLLYENRNRKLESRRYTDFSERLDELKAVILASIATPNLRDIARGAIQYRHLINFLSSFKFADLKDIVVSINSWEYILEEAGVIDITEEQDSYFRPALYFILKDQTFYRARLLHRHIDALKKDWHDFVRLEQDSRMAIVEALLEDHDRRRPLMVYINKPFKEYIKERSQLRELDIDGSGLEIGT